MNSCEACHQLGDKATREIPASLGHFDSSAAAWARRISSAQAGVEMNTFLTPVVRSRPCVSDVCGLDGPDQGGGISNRSAATTTRRRAERRDNRVGLGHTEGVLPRPDGDGQRNPTVNANGLLYGMHEEANDLITYLDPVHNTTGEIPIPVTEGTPYAAKQDMSDPSPYWGDEMIWTSKANAHSDEMDSKGRLWFTDVTKPRDNPGLLQARVEQSLGLALSARSERQKRCRVRSGNKEVHACHHVFRHPSLDVYRGWHQHSVVQRRSAMSWVGSIRKCLTKLTMRRRRRAGPHMVVDTNGNGKRDAYVEPGQPADPTKDTRVKSRPLRSQLRARLTTRSGEFRPLSPGTSFTSSWARTRRRRRLTEVYQPPYQEPEGSYSGLRASRRGYRPQRSDVDGAHKRSFC